MRVEHERDPVLPVHPAAPWLGGKKLLAKRIIERLRQVPHAGYVEPFVGMGGVFLRRPWRVRTEVINDAAGMSPTSSGSSSGTTCPSWTCCAGR